MSIIDLKNSADLDTLQSSICVIGSGAAGGILAVALAQEGVDVIVIEAGANLPDYNCDSIASTNLHSDVSDLRFGWSQQFGGASNLWAGRTHPLEEIDFEKRSWVPDSGWPFSIESLKPYYKKSAEILGIPAYKYFEDKALEHRDKNSFSIALDNNSGLDDKCFQWASKPFNTSDYLTQAVQTHSNLRILLNAPVTQLQECGDGSKIETVQIKKPDGSILNVQAKNVIIAAGGIQTPRLLLNSNTIKKAGIGNENDVVGRYFSTHPKADMAAIILNKPTSTSHAMFMDSPLQSGSFRYGLGFSKTMQQRHKLLNHYVQLSPLLEYQANKTFEAIKKTKVLNHDLIDRNKLVQGFLPGIGKMTYEIMGRIAKFQPKTKKFILRGFLDQYPDKDNRIKLSPEKNEDGTHKIDVQWRFSDKDKDSVLSFFANLDTILKEHNIGIVEYSALEHCKDWPLISVHSHLMGTTRMGHDPKTSVTDANGLVHNTNNLYIAGPSLFPTYGFANPFLTISALSLRLADHLLKKVK